MTQPEAHEAVKQVFSELRKTWLLARMNYLCCSSCAGYALGERADELAAKDKPVRGAVYYHRQDADHWEHSGKLDIRFRAWTPKGMDYSHEAELTRGIGHQVVAALRGKGLNVEWGGDHYKCIQVHV